MNPRFHDEFVALCALFYSGEITDEEWALLQVHMAYCDSCRGTFEEFERVSREVIPAMAVAAASEQANFPREPLASLEDAERRLMSRLDAASQPQPSRVTSKTSWRLAGGALAACVVALIVFASTHFIRGREVSQRARPDSMAIGVHSAEPQPAAIPDRTRDEQIASQRDAAEIARLRQELRERASLATLPTSASSSLQRQLQTEQAQREQLAADKEALSEQVSGAQANIQQLQAKLRSADASMTEQVARVVDLEARERTLNVRLADTNSILEDRERMLALDKDFLAHDRDIRDLIGARNLYIADIYDTTASGKTAKPFGRIFYTQDRSLVFYGFDLEKQEGLRRSVAFQAWGSGSDRQPVSLGLFYQDESRQRWVVRCEDAKTLAHLNMVFVTVEPAGGSSKPTGKQLLRAYLQINPNHP